MKINIIKRAKEVLDIEACAIKDLKSHLNHDFEKAINLILKSKGRIVVSGMGKTGIIAQKFSATLASSSGPGLHWSLICFLNHCCLKSFSAFSMFYYFSPVLTFGPDPAV